MIELLSLSPPQYALQDLDQVTTVCITMCFLHTAASMMSLFTLLPTNCSSLIYYQGVESLSECVTLASFDGSCVFKMKATLTFVSMPLFPLQSNPILQAL